jgi:hypothetical protein
MSRHTTANDIDRAADPLSAWRSERLRVAGFDSALAERVAIERSFDVHALLELTDRGCPPELAVRIVAPLDWAQAW